MLRWMTTGEPLWASQNPIAEDRGGYLKTVNVSHICLSGGYEASHKTKNVPFNCQWGISSWHNSKNVSFNYQWGISSWHNSKNVSFNYQWGISSWHNSKNVSWNRDCWKATVALQFPSQSFPLGSVHGYCHYRSFTVPQPKLSAGLGTWLLSLP
jgi:hypothetical protein